MASISNFILFAGMVIFAAPVQGWTLNQPTEWYCPNEPFACASKPTTIPNGQVTQIKDPFGHVALSFACEPDYILVGKEFTTCCSGFWIHGIPKCAARDCLTHYKEGARENGMYLISLDGVTSTLVYCDMMTAEGGWTVIQRRQDASTDFYRAWEEYKQGFGNSSSNYWMGLENIHQLTEVDSELYVSMNASATDGAYAHYDKFKVSSEADKYRLEVSGYSGTAGDSMRERHNGSQFSTLDADHDKRKTASFSCATKYKGGWWYGDCHLSNPNGLYLDGPYKGIAKGIVWSTYKGFYYSLRFIEMKVRRKKLLKVA